MCHKCFKLGTMGLKAVESHMKREKHKTTQSTREQMAGISQFCSTTLVSATPPASSLMGCKPFLCSAVFTVTRYTCSLSLARPLNPYTHTLSLKGATLLLQHYPPVWMEIIPEFQSSTVTYINMSIHTDIQSSCSFSQFKWISV